ncbi:hypothetical protein EON65_10925 [archaeon]|nr:MAG: hypothetical protein EON65_10925 [archaeon]
METKENGPPDGGLCNPSLILLSLRALRHDAEGCILQGGHEQLQKAMILLNSWHSILHNQLSSCKEAEWHQHECAQCAFGIARVQAAQKHYDAAEKVTKQAMQILISTLPLFNTGKFRLLLIMTTFLNCDIYLVEADNMDRAQENPSTFNKKLILLRSKAWCVLNWFVAFICGDITATSLSIICAVDHIDLTTKRDEELTALHQTIISLAVLKHICLSSDIKQLH